MSPSAVLDASAVLALLRDEPGADDVDEILARGAAISTVNISEVCARLNRQGIAPDMVRRTIDDLDVMTEPFLLDDATRAGEWAAATRRHGLSLGDRACLALAWRLGVPAVSTDRVWRDLDLPVQVQILDR